MSAGNTLSKLGKVVMYAGWAASAGVAVWGLVAILTRSMPQDKAVILLGGAFAGAWVSTLIGGSISASGNAMLEKEGKLEE